MKHKPQPKVAAAGIGGSAATLIVFLASQVGVEVSPEVAAALVTVVSFAAGFVKS